MSVGATLAQARGARKLTIDALSRATRIPAHIIAAMEQDEWSKIPGGIFTRGYLRSVAREIGLDAAGLVALYDAEQAPPPEAAEDATAAPADARKRVVLRVRFPALSEAGDRWVTGSAMIALLFFVYVAGRWSTAEDRPETPVPAALESPLPANALGARATPAVGTSAASADTPTPSTARGASGSGAPAPGGDRRMPGADAPLVLDVSVTRPCWVTASADGERTIYRLLQPGDRVQTRGRVVMLRVGDAGALLVSVDGGPARPLGGNGEVVTLRLTRENYRSLLPATAGD